MTRVRWTEFEIQHGVQMIIISEAMCHCHRAAQLQQDLLAPLTVLRLAVHVFRLKLPT